MGIRGELFSTRVALPNRTYFFNVKENRMGDLYLNIVESKNQETGGFERQSVILFADDLKDFLTGFDESLRVMEKAVREKRKGDSPRPGSKPFSSNKAKDSYKPRGTSQDKPRFAHKDSKNPRIRVVRKDGPRTKNDTPGDKPYRKPGRRVYKRED